MILMLPSEKESGKLLINDDVLHARVPFDAGWLGHLFQIYPINKPRMTRIKYEGLHHGSSYLEHLTFLSAIRGEGRADVDLEDGLMAVVVGVVAARLSIEQRHIDKLQR